MRSATQILAAAFANDPLTSFVEPDPARRDRMLRRLMGSWLRWCRIDGR